MKRFICLPVMSMLLAAGPTHAAAPQWTLAESAGPVSVLAKGRTSEAKPGDAIPDDVAVLTGVNGRAVLTRGADRVTLSPTARLRVAAEGALFADRGKTSFAFVQRSGVTTPFLVAEGGSTSFSVMVSDGGASVQPGQGLVDVATLDGAARQRIEPGMIALVGADRRDQLLIDGSAHRIVGPRAAATPVTARTADGAVEIAALP